MGTDRTEYLAGRALEYAELRLLQKLPYFAGALALAGREWKSGPSGMDGDRFLWNPCEVCGWYAEDPVKLERRYLHLLMHGLYLHPFREIPHEHRIRDLACDMMTEYRLDIMAVPGFERPVSADRSRSYRRLKEEGCPLTERGVARWLSGQKEETLCELERIFRWDDHKLWDASIQEEERSFHRERMSSEQPLAGIKAVHRWRTAFEQLELRQEEHRKQAGGSAGSGVQSIVLEKERGYDYRRFLKQFAQEREEVCLDMDSFDYIPYDYSRRMYDRLLFIEPLEYKDMRKLEEFVIAIDTSGSCSGEVVRQFLEQTWEIFCEEDNFFRRVNIHLIQCDCLIQEHVRITCEEDWKDYLNHIEVKGHGDTDFTPVFRLVDRLREAGELKSLKGLLYFTDGDGIYPEEKPDYETAFVFLSEGLRKGRAPDWAVTLTLDRELGTGA